MPFLYEGKEDGSGPNPFPSQPGKQKLNKGLIETKSMQICICLQKSESVWYQSAK